MKAVFIILVALILLLSGCIAGQQQDQNKAEIKEEVQVPEKIVELNDEVKVDYVGFLDDGKLFDTSIKEEAVKAGLPLRQSYEPLSVKIGAGQVIKGFEDGLKGMKEGEEKTVKIPPEQAYGMPREDLIQSISFSQFPDAKNLIVGQEIQTNVGQAKVLKVDENSVTLDFNHPLAGKTLNFKLIVRQVIKAEPGM